MTDDWPPDTDAADLHDLKLIAGSVTDHDFQRDEVPPELWTAIANELAHPVNEVVKLRTSRRRALLGAAAAVLAVVVTAGGLLATSKTSENVVAQAALSNEGLSPLGAASSGKAEIFRRGASYVLHVDVAGVPQEPASYVEVWLIDRQVKGMVSLGPLRSDGDYAIPSGVDPATFPIVDMSIEPTDGVPTHSGVSIVRGVTTA
jgi:anti-sigma-K factor RskA